MIIKEIEKNRRERITVSIDDYKGHTVCSVRVFVEVEPEKWLPTKKGITLSAKFLEEIINALQEARRQFGENA